MNEPEAQQLKRWGIRAAIGAVAAVLVGWGTLSWNGAITPTEPDELNLTALLAGLFLAALFIERSLEIYIRAFRAGPRTRMMNEIEFLKEDVEELKAISNPTDPQLSSLAECKNQLVEKTHDLQRHRSKSEAIALQLGLVLGLVVSIAGLRALSVLFSADGLSDDVIFGSWTQKHLFNFADVVLTAGMLGGGSKGIHALTQIIGNTMDTLANSAAKGST
ncbi:MAG: hypothetical protein O7G86_19320 [Gammaproteobacteria bacterium]|nr:hypothetical protein [Gammaproteobacteria bacterium]